MDNCDHIVKMQCYLKCGLQHLGTHIIWKLWFMQVNGPNHRPLGFQNVEGNKNKSYAHIYVNVHIHRFTDLDTRARIIKGHCQRFKMRERDRESTWDAEEMHATLLSQSRRHTGKEEQSWASDILVKPWEEQCGTGHLQMLPGASTLSHLPGKYKHSP